MRLARWKRDISTQGRGMRDRDGIRDGEAARIWGEGQYFRVIDFGLKLAELVSAR